MAGIRLEWAQFGDFDSFDELRSDAPMGINALPSPIATNLPTMYHVDTTVVEGATYYYRVVAWRDGVSKLSGEIQVKASDGDEHWDKVVALLHFDGDLTDEAGDAWASIGSPSITDTNHLFDKNILFSGGGAQHITKTFADALGTDDFTIEMFIRRAAHSNYRCIFDSRSSAISDGIAIYTSSSLTGNVPVIWTSTQVLMGVSEIPHSEWVHIAVCRKSKTLYYFTGGILQNSANFTNDLTNKLVRLGATREGIQSYGGHIDELRITKGVARYTANFTPPDAPFPSY